MKHHNLRTKTIFDFTSDKQLLAEEFGITENESEYKKISSIERKLMDLYGIAEILADVDLEKAINKAFAKELDKFGFE